MHFDSRCCVISNQTAVLTLLLRSVLTLPLETVGRQEVVFVAMVFVQLAFLQRHQQEHVTVTDDESLIPDGRTERQTKQRCNILAHIVPPCLGRRIWTLNVDRFHLQSITGGLEGHLESCARSSRIRTKPTANDLCQHILLGFTVCANDVDKLLDLAP